MLIQVCMIPKAVQNNRICALSTSVVETSEVAHIGGHVRWP
jgi:hypothetical protein